MGIGVLLLVVPSLASLSIVSDGTASLMVHVEDTTGNPIEGMSVWAFPFYDSNSIPYYPPPSTYPEYLTNANGNVEIILTYLNTQPVPNTSNSVCSQIVFYADGYKKGTNFAVQYGYLYAVGVHTALDGSTSSLNIYFGLDEDPHHTTPLDFLNSLSMVLGWGCLAVGGIMYYKEKKKQ